MIGQSEDRKTLTQPELEGLAKRVKDWVSSPEGTAKLLETQKSVQSEIEVAEKAARIGPELLQKPVTL